MRILKNTRRFTVFGQIAAKVVFIILQHYLIANDISLFYRANFPRQYDYCRKNENKNTQYRNGYFTLYVASSLILIILIESYFFNNEISYPLADNHLPFKTIVILVLIYFYIPECFSCISASLRYTSSNGRFLVSAFGSRFLPLEQISYRPIVNLINLSNES